MKAADIVAHVKLLANRGEATFTDALIYAFMNQFHYELQRAYNFPFMLTSATIMGGSGTGQSTGPGAGIAGFSGFVNWMAALPIMCKEVVSVFQSGAEIPNGATDPAPGPYAANKILNTFHYVPPVDRDENWIMTVATYYPVFNAALSNPALQRLKKLYGPMIDEPFATRVIGVGVPTRVNQFGYRILDSGPMPSVTNPAAVETACTVDIRPRQYLVKDPRVVGGAGGFPMFIVNYYRYLGDYNANTLEAPVRVLDEDPFTLLAQDLMIHGTMEKISEYYLEDERAAMWRQKKMESLMSFLSSQGIRPIGAQGPQPKKQGEP